MTQDSGRMGGIILRTLVTVWTLFILFLSVWPFSSTPDVEGSDKIVHFLMYAVTTLVYMRAGLGWFRSILLSSILGLAMEILQTGLPWRSFSVGDILANLAGVALAGGWVRAGLPVPWVVRGPMGRGRREG